MSCANHATVSVFAPRPIRVRLTVWRAIAIVIDVLHEAIAMRRAAHRARPMLDE